MNRKPQYAGILLAAFAINALVFAPAVKADPPATQQTLVKKADLADLVPKSDLANLATKADLEEIRVRLQRLRERLAQMRGGSPSTVAPSAPATPKPKP